MKVIRLKEPGVWESYSQNLTAPNLDVNEALVKVYTMGVCGTDLHAFKGNQPFFTYPRVLGHELAVQVLEVGSEVTNVHVGDTCYWLPCRR